MEIILRQDLDNLGYEGDIVDVAKGYARNYLIPKGIAFEATPQNLKALETIRKKIEVKRLKAKEEAEKLKERIAGLTIVFSQKAGAEGKLYGSVTNIDVAAELEKEGIVIDRRKVVLDKPIKTVGDFEIPIRLYPEVVGSVRVTVNPEEEKEK
jgi:large subunit ribosomal protein L9